MRVKWGRQDFTTVNTSVCFLHAVLSSCHQQHHHHFLAVINSPILSELQHQLCIIWAGGSAISFPSKESTQWFGLPKWFSAKQFYSPKQALPPELVTNPASAAEQQAGCRWMGTSLPINSTYALPAEKTLHLLECRGGSLLKQFLSVSSDREIKGEIARGLTCHIFEVVCSCGYIQRARQLLILFQSLPRKQNELQKS